MEKAAASDMLSGDPKNGEDDAKLLESLERTNNWDNVPMNKIQGFWCPEYLIRPLSLFQGNFKAQDTDIVLASVPKSGTTWMKALMHSIVYRNNVQIDQSPLLSISSHYLVRSLECHYYNKGEEKPNLEYLTQPRLFSTHLPYQGLSESLVMNSGSKIVYVSRNPLDQFVSEHQFLAKFPYVPYEGSFGTGIEILPVEEAFDMVCDGVQAFGPYWDHLLGYWKASLENPDKVLFVKFEDLKRDPASNVRKIAEFVKLPFSEGEEERGLVEEIIRLCSFDKLRNLEVNKSGVHYKHVMNHTFYRKGDIGDWKDHLSVEKAERMRKILEEKFEGSDLIIDF